MNKKILILDDDINVLKSIERNLYKKGFELHTFTEMKDAIDAVAKNNFALVITDYYLSSSIGTDFLTEVKQISPNTVRVLMTGKPDLTIAFEAVNKVNIFRILIKPFNFPELLDVINSSLHQYHLQDLERIDNLKNEFFSIISHEFRTPFTVINSYLELIQFELEDADIKKEKLDEYIEAVKEGNERILRTINLIVNLAQAQLDDIKIEKTLFNLYDDVVLPILKNFQLRATKKNISINVKKSPVDFKIIADLMQTTEIFRHLLENAVIYTESGTIDIVLSLSSTKAYLSVVDSGIGISEEYIDKIFEPFIQENRGYSRLYDGNGLGLTLAKKYCELNNFELSVKSIKNEGSIFTITFDQKILENI